MECEWCHNVLCTHSHWILSEQNKTAHRRKKMRKRKLRKRLWAFQSFLRYWICIPLDSHTSNHTILANSDRLALFFYTRIRSHSYRCDNKMLSESKVMCVGGRWLVKNSVRSGMSLQFQLLLFVVRSQFCCCRSVLLPIILLLLLWSLLWLLLWFLTKHVICYRMYNCMWGFIFI